MPGTCWERSRPIPTGSKRRPARPDHNALASATKLGTRPLVAHCHLGLGTLYRRTRKR